jgi:hypothetical protein
MSNPHTLQWLGLEEATTSGKKWTAHFRDTSTGKIFSTHFGARGYEDYTMHGDKNRRENYWNRHTRDLDTLDPSKPGYLSLYLLWGPSTNLKRNVKLYLKHFRIPDKSS